MTKKRTSKTEREGQPKIKQPNAQIVIHKYPSLIEWIGNSSLSISNSKVTFWIALILVFVPILAYFPTMGDDYDIWFHLKYGEHYVKNLTWAIDHSQFSWTPSLTNWKYVTWIGSSILYIVYQIGSAPGLYILQWLILLGIGALYVYFIRTTGNAFDINHAMGLFLIAVPLNLTSDYIKPELFSTLFFSFTLLIYFRAKSSSKNLFLLYPILFLIWVNTHGGFVIGLFFISVALFGEAVNFFFIKKASMPKGLLKHFAIAAALSYLAILCNPYGITYHTEIFNNLFSKEYMGQSIHLFAYLNLWDYLFPKILMIRFVAAAWSMVVMGILFIAINLYAYRKNRHLDITVLILNALFFYFGMKAARAAIFFPLIWLFSMVYTAKSGEAAPVKRKFAPIALLLILFLSTYIIYNTLTHYEHRSWFGLGLDEWLPIKEVEFIKKHKIPGPIFNDYVIGGYMIWAMYPDYKVFIDPRFGPYIKQVWPDWVDLQNILNPEGLKKFTSKYQFKSALIHMREPYIIFWFLSSPEWRLVYFDKAAAVIIHKSVIPTLSPEALATDVSTNRFRDLVNPLILSRLFDFYIQVGPSYAREILNLYATNVSSLYYLKTQKIQEMQALINQKELQLRQIQIQQQQQQQQQQSAK